MKGGNVASLMTASDLPRHDRYARSSLEADRQVCLCATGENCQVNFELIQFSLND